MSKNAKSLNTVALSVAGVAIAFVIIVLVNFIAGRVNLRADLTQDKLYTLSQGTRNILKGLDTDVNLRYYVTQDSEALPQELQSYVRKVEDLLIEFKKQSKHVKLKKFDPEPDSDDELAANQAGIQGAELQGGSAVIYNGIEIQCLDKRSVLPFVSPQQEKTLEYDLARAITEVVREKKPIIGLMTDLEIAGGQMNPMMMQQGRGPTPAWHFFEAVRKDFDVRTLPLSTEEIDSEISTLIVAHPQNITEAAEYAIDQYIMGGGKVIAMLDPDYTIPQRSGNPMMMGGENSSTFNKLLGAWGITMTNQVVADRKFMWTGGRRREPKMIFLTEEGMNNDDVTTNDLKTILLGHAGAFSGSPAPGLTKTPLLQSSDQSQMVAAGFSQENPDAVLTGFSPDGKRHDIAIRLQGKFKTAFPDGKPKSEDEEDEDDEGSEGDGNGAEEGESPEDAAPIKESPETAVILIADIDFLFDAFYSEQMRFGGQVLRNFFASNLVFVQNVIEQLSGDQNLIEVRSRAASRRRFTRIAEMEAQAEDKYRNRIKEFEEKIQKANDRINELQAVKADEGQNVFVLSPEQQEELGKLQAEKLKLREALRNVRKDLREDVDSLKNRLKWQNILLVPAFVVLVGLVRSAIRRIKTAAK